MTSALDQVSFQLGTLDANVAILIQRAEKRDAEQKLMLASLAKIETAIEPMVKEIAFMKPHVAQYAGIRRRVALVGAFLLTAGGTLGGMIGNYLVKKYGV